LKNGIGSFQVNGVYLYKDWSSLEINQYKKNWLCEHSVAVRMQNNIYIYTYIYIYGLESREYGRRGQSR
jgi:hypothetical protein